MRALIIEDDRKIAQFVARGLAEQDFGIEQCDTGEKALELLSRESFDVAILDLMLPDIDGLIVLKKLRAERPNPPVLVLSAKRSVDNRVECLAAGADDYMTKPFAFLPGFRHCCGEAAKRKVRLRLLLAILRWIFVALELCAAT